MSGKVALDGAKLVRRVGGELNDSTLRLLNEMRGFSKGHFPVNNQ